MLVSGLEKLIRFTDNDEDSDEGFFLNKQCLPAVMRMIFHGYENRDGNVSEDN